MSANKNSLGKIITCSSNVKPNLGFTRDGLIGKNIGAIMPAIFRSLHDNLMQLKM